MLKIEDTEIRLVMVDYYAGMNSSDVREYCYGHRESDREDKLIDYQKQSRFGYSSDVAFVIPSKDSGYYVDIATDIKIPKVEIEDINGKMRFVYVDRNIKSRRNSALSEKLVGRSASLKDVVYYLKQASDDPQLLSSKLGYICGYYGKCENAPKEYFEDTGIRSKILNYVKECGFLSDGISISSFVPGKLYSLNSCVVNGSLPLTIQCQNEIDFLDQLFQVADIKSESFNDRFDDITGTEWFMVKEDNTFEDICTNLPIPYVYYQYDSINHEAVLMINDRRAKSEEVVHYFVPFMKNPVEVPFDQSQIDSFIEYRRHTGRKHSTYEKESKIHLKQNHVFYHLSNNTSFGPTAIKIPDHQFSLLVDSILLLRNQIKRIGANELLYNLSKIVDDYELWSGEEEISYDHVEKPENDLDIIRTLCSVKFKKKAEKYFVESIMAIERELDEEGKYSQNVKEYFQQMFKPLQVLHALKGKLVNSEKVYIRDILPNFLDYVDTFEDPEMRLNLVIEKMASLNEDNFAASLSSKLDMIEYLSEYMYDCLENVDVEKVGQYVSQLNNNCCEVFIRQAEEKYQVESLEVLPENKKKYLEKLLVNGRNIAAPVYQKKI